MTEGRTGGWVSLAMGVHQGTTGFKRKNMVQCWRRNYERQESRTDQVGSFANLWNASDENAVQHRNRVSCGKSVVG